MERLTKLSLAMLALLLATSLVATEARDLKAAKPAEYKPQTFPPFDRMFPNPALGGAGSSFGMPRFGMGSSPLGGSSALPGFSWPGFGVPGNNAATNQEKKP